MPRDGSNIYHVPVGTDAITDTTIDSAKYNSFIHDVEADLNAPRPISSGGTGADNPADAMTALGGEIAKQVITNYDIDVFRAGSFYSAAGATLAPVSGHAFSGICYLTDANNMFVEASDQDDVSQPGRKWLRQKKSGIWSGWATTAGAASGATPPSPAADNAFWWDPNRGKLFFRYNDGNTSQWVEAVVVPDVDPNTFVEIAGDTMTGMLTLFADPTTALHAATKQYVDGGISGVGGAPNVRYTAQTLTSAQRAQARSNIDVTKKNYIINGAMMISQENGATAGPATLTGYFAVDQFKAAIYGSTGAFSAIQVLVPSPSGSPNKLQCYVVTADAVVAVGDIAWIEHSIEGLRVADLLFGTANAKTITVQFGVRAPAGTYSFSVLNNSTSSRCYISEYVISAGEANAYVTRSITIPGDVTGTWAKDNTVGFMLRWGLMVGATYQQAPGSWGANASGAVGSPNQFNFMGTVGNVFELFDVSLTEGTVAPPFQVPDYASELALCQRYWESTGFSVTSAVSPYFNTIWYQAPKRATPTFVMTGSSFSATIGIINDAPLYGLRQLTSASNAGDVKITVNARL